MTQINSIPFSANNPLLSVTEIDRHTPPPPPLTLVNKNKSVYFNKNKFLSSGNTAGKRKINIAIQYDIKQAYRLTQCNTPEVLTSPNIRGGGGVKHSFTDF